LLKSHELFYGKELQGVPSSHLVVQPLNRGALPAVLYALSRLNGLDRDAVVAFFPSDHHYSNEDNFAAGIDLAFNAAENNANNVVLLGAPATYPATDYGWIEVEPARSTRSYRGFLRAKRFWEKPPLKVAKDLLDRGCVWNTFVMVGRAGAFVNLIRSAAPDFYEAFRPIWGEWQPQLEAPIVSKIYRDLAVADLTREVLSKTLESLGVFCLGDVGWSDGDPRRALVTMNHPEEHMMTAKDIERAAYIAAYRIVEADTAVPPLACTGARRSHAVDTIADIIREVFELYNLAPEELSKRVDEISGPHLANYRRREAVLELPVPSSLKMRSLPIGPQD
jgi:mannose-1-phosphate guanylyltransferase